MNLPAQGPGPVAWKEHAATAGHPEPFPPLLPLLPCAWLPCPPPMTPELQEAQHMGGLGADCQSPPPRPRDRIHWPTMQRMARD